MRILFCILISSLFLLSCNSNKKYLDTVLGANYNNKGDSRCGSVESAKREQSKVKRIQKGKKSKRRK